MLEQDVTVDGVVVFLGADLDSVSSTSSSGSVPETSTSTSVPATTTTSAAMTTTTRPVGVIPGDPPPGSSCG